MQRAPRVAPWHTCARCQTFVPSPSFALSATSALSATNDMSGLPDDAVGDARPGVRAAPPAAVDERGDARQVGGGQALVLGVVGLHDGGVDLLAEVVGVEAELAQLLVGVH